MTRQKVTAVFQTGLAFEHRFYQVTQNSEYADDYSDGKPLQWLDAQTVIRHEEGCDESEDEAPQKAFDGFVG